MKRIASFLFIMLFLANAINQVAGIPILYSLPILIGLQIFASFYLPSNIACEGYGDNPDFSKLVDYGGKHAKTLIATMTNGLDFLNDMTLIPNVKTKQQIGILDIGSGVRPFSDEEEFQENDLQYSDRWIATEDCKREILISPRKYRTQFTAETLTAGSGASQKQLPFEAWTWKQIVKSVWSEVNNNTIWDGFDRSTATAYNAANTYAVDDIITYTPTGQTVKQWFKCLSATSAGQNPDSNSEKWLKVTANSLFKGFKERFIEEANNGKITEIALGAIDSTNGVAKAAFKELYRSFPAIYRNAGIIINCSYTDWDLLQDDIEDVSKYTRHDNTVGPGQAPEYMILPGTNGKCVVKPATWINSRRLIAGPLGTNGKGKYVNKSLLFGTDLVNDFNNIVVKEHGLWKIKAGLTFLGGTQLGPLQELRINDQE